MIHVADSSSLARHPLRKRLAWFGATLLALEILYLVAGNLFLHFALMPIVNRRPEKVFMSYESAYTLWPGVAHVSHFRLRSQDSAIQWMLDVDAADVTIDITAFFGRTFHATRTRASGVAFKLRRKLDDDDASGPRAAVVVPIEGFDDPPLKPIGPPKPPVSDADYADWRVDMEDVDALVREVWIDEWRCLGSAEVAGGFFIAPQRLIQIGPSTIDVHEGEFQVGGRPALNGIEAHIESVVGAIDLRTPVEVAVRAISARGRVDGVVPNLDYLKLYLPSDQTLRVDDGGGALHARFTLTNGRIMPGTLIDLNSDRLVLGAKTFDATVAFEAEARVDASTAGPMASGDLLVRSATISRNGAKGSPPSIQNGRAHFTGLPRDLAGPAEIERTDLDVPMRFPDLHWLLPANGIGKQPPIDLAGAATLRARIALDRDMTASGLLTAHSNHTEIRTAAFDASARLSTNVAFQNGHLDTKSVVFDPSSLVATDLAIARHGRDHAGGRVRIDVGEGRLEDGVPHYLAFTIAAKLRDFGWLALGNEKRNAAARAGDVRASFVVRRPAALFDDSSIDPGLRGSVAAALSADGRIDDVALRGRLMVSARIDGFDPARRAIRFASIETALDDVSIARGSSHVGGWWGRFAVRPFDLGAASPMRVVAHVEARCKDGAPFLAVLASAGTIPSWVGAIFPMNGLTASGDLKTHDVVDLKLAVKSTSVDVTARLHDIAGKMDGAVLVKTTVLSVGVGLVKGQSHVTFFAGEEWLKAHIDALEQAEDRSRAALAARDSALRF